MSKKKNSSIYGQLYTADEYKEKQKYGNLYTAEEYKNVLAQREAEYKRQLEEQRQRAERASRIVGNYKMNKQYPAQWAPGGKADRLLTAADRLKQQKEEAQNPQAVKPADFRDWSMVDNLLNPKSKVNAQIAKRPKDEQEYWNGVRQNVNDALNNPRGNMSRADAMLKTQINVGQKKQKEIDTLQRVLQQGPSDPVKNTRDYIYEYNAMRDNNLYTGNDLKRMSKAQLQQYVTQNQQALDEANRKNANKPQQELEQQGVQGKSDIYNVLANFGVPYYLNEEDEPTGTQQDSGAGIQYMTGRPEDYEGNEEKYNEILYDYIHGEGAYGALVNDMMHGNDAEYDAAQEELDELWDAMDSGEIRNIANSMRAEDYNLRGELAENNYAGEYEQNIRAGQEELENRSRIQELEENAPEGYWQYDPEKVNYHINLQTGKTDQIYYYANMDLTAEDVTDFQKYGNLRPEQFMTDEQLNTFNGYYLNGMYDEAQAYFDGLEPYLQQMKGEYKTVLEQQMYNNGWAIPMTGIRIATKPVEGVVGMIGTGAALLGNKEWRNPDSDVWGLSKTNMNIQNTSAEAWGKQFAAWFGGGDKGFAAEAGRFLNGVMFSIADNITAFAMSGGASALSEAGAEKIASGLIQFVMSSEATASTMYEKLQSGMDPTQAAIMAYGSGIIEAVTEKYSLEQILDPNVRELLGTKGAFLRYLGKSALAEGSEEVASDLLDTGLDYVMSAIYGNKAELTQKYEDLIASGMDEGEATRTVIWEYIQQLGQSGLAGALSGLLMSGSRGVNTRIRVNQENAQLATKAMKSGVNTEADSATQAGQKATNLFKIIETGEGFRAGTETNALAKKIRAEIREGKSVDKAAVGNLVRTIVNESSDVVSNTMRNVLGDAFVEELNSAGIEGDYAENLKGALTDIIVDGKYDARSMQLIAGSQAAQKIMSEFRMGGFQEQVKKAQDLTQKERAASQSVMEMITEPQAEGVTQESVEAKMDGAEWLQKGDAELEQAEGKATGKAGEVVADGMIGTVVGFGTKTENGQTYATAMIEAAGKTMEVDLADVKATSEATAKVLQFMQSENGQSLGSNLGAAVVQIATKKNAAGVMNDAVNIMMSDLFGTAEKVTTLSTKEQQQIREALEKDKAEADAKAAQNHVELTPGQGKITYDGTTYGTRAFADKLSGLDKGIRDEANYVAQLMKSIGMNVDFYYDNSEEGSGRQGAFIGTKGIRINLAGTFKTDGTHRSIVATAGHEATHWLRANSPAAYRRLQAFAMQALQKAGMNLQGELRHIMDNYQHYGEHLTLDKAAEEMVAMGCEQIFTDEKLVSQLRAEDPTLYGKVRQAVKRVVDMMRNVFTGAKATSSRYARAVESTLNELAQKWKIAYEEAKSLEKDMEASDGTETHYGDHEKFSYRVTDPEELNFLNNQDTVTTYKSMQLIDGKLYPPMAAVVAGNMEDYSELGQWEKAAEHPELIKSGNKFTLNKGKGKGSLDAAYNPYMHSSNLMINDQFSGAYNRPNLVTVECKVPVSELTSGYHAEYAKDTVGWHGWHTGPVAGQLRQQKGQERQVMLSRWIQPVRIVPDAEVAQHYKELLAGTDIAVPDNVVTPSLREELIKAGVKVGESGRVSYSMRDDMDKEYAAVVEMGRYDMAEKMVDRAAKEAGYTIKAYHGTPNGKFNVFEKYKIGTSTDFGKLGRGFYFTNKKQVADYYAGYLNSSTVMPVYLKMDNPFVLSRNYDNMSVKEFYDSILGEGGIVDENRSEELTKWLIDNGYDGIEADGEYMVLDPENIKSAETVTYDKYGDVIPLSERFNPEKEDIRWSMRDDTDYDVRQWMETVPEWSLQTEAEKTLLKNYNGLQMKQRLDRERMRKIDKDLLNLEAQLTEERTGRVEAQETMENALESAGVSVRDGHWLQKDGKIVGKIEADGTITMNKGAPESVYQDLRKAGFGFSNKKGTFRPAMSAPTRTDGKPTIQVLLGKSEAQRQRDALLKKREALRQTMDEQEEKLAEITKDEGFGRMMYQQQKLLDDLQNFGTQQELLDYVARMEKAAQEVAARIEQNRKAVEELEKGGIVGQFRKLLGTTSAEQTAAELKKEYSSTWTAKQIRAYLDPIILKMKTGEDFSADVETLAGILVNSDSRNRYETLEDLRGLTITLGKGAQAELKAQNSSLKEVRARLAGTGITVKYGERSTLEADIADLRAEYPMIPELGDEKDALGNFLNWIDSMKSASAGMEFYDQRIAEAMAMITAKAAGAAKGIYMPNDPKAQKQVMAMMDFVKGLNAETAEAQKTLADIAKQMGEMQKSGLQATNRATTLMRDVNVAIDYYQKIGKIAADEAKQTKVSAHIEQLKSDQAKEILRSNEEWRQLIQRDKDAREQLEENRKYTRQINTNLKRTWNLLKNPKGLNNVPEYMQGMAREVLKMFVNNDMGHGSRFLNATQEELAERMRVLDAWEKQDGKFDRNQLNALDAENVKADVIMADLDKITEALKVLNAYRIYGKNKLDVLQQRGAIISQIRDAVSEIYSAIKAEQEVQIGDRRVAVEDAADAVAQGTNGKKYREWKGAAGQKIAMLHKFIVSGNMTPEYFFRTIGNAGLSDLWDNYHRAENRNGLELKKAKDRMEEIAEEYGYKDWDMKQKITLNLESGDVEITLGQLMSLWATWKREKTLGPEMSEHLTKGGFYADVDLRDGLLGRATIEKRAHTVTEADMNQVAEKLMDKQKQFIDAVVGFMSRDMSELGNEASMAAYGIKLYKESYYFPFQIWNGVKSRKSNEAGGAAAAQDRAFHPSFSKSRMHGANNAIMIGDFMQTATDHIAGMINYATMGLANESLMKVLNQQTAEDTYGTKRNTEAILEEAYGREAMQYLRELQVQLNGGAVKVDKTFYDKLISAFRKNAVAGSLSVALQQPLSYLRAAMMIDNRYLARAISPDMWKGSYQEMIQHSGVAVIKEMGRFDMNFGASAREYLTPDGKEGKARAAWNWVADKSTMLPEMMDRMTWTRMWSAVKAEQKALHPEMDVKSDRFLDMCGERFNDIMRRTQVYDSTLVKSANMRTQNPAMKMLTSFMAEPTLTANVLADSFRMAVQGEKGGKMAAVKASAIFLLSAIAQAAVKGAMGARRNPDEKKTWGENFWYRFWYNLIGEVNPLQLVPGYDEAITALKGGDISDDAMGTLSKLVKAGDKVMDLLRGDEKNAWRGVEDSVGQIVQLFTRVPMKNLMRDLRATYNWIGTDPYAKREDSAAVLKYQFKDTLANADSLWGVINKKLGEAGWETSNSAYYKRIYDAKKEGREQDAADMIEYLLKGKGIKKEESITSSVNSLAKKDKTQTPEERLEFLQENGGKQLGGYVKEMYEEGEIDREKAEKMYREANPKAKDKDVLEALDSVDYEKAGGTTENYSNYTPIKEALNAGDDGKVEEARKYLLDHGYEEKDIESTMKEHITNRYKDGEITREETEKMLKKYRPDLSADDIFWTLDLIDYKKETGNADASGKYYRLWDAMEENKIDNIRSAVKLLTAHGVDKKSIKSTITKQYKDKYLKATNSEKVKIKDAIEKAYKEMGYSKQDADKIIENWTKKKN